METRIVIGGCRDYNDYQNFCRHMDKILLTIDPHQHIIILSGHCTGVDTMAERYAKEHDFDLEIFPAEWKKYGKFAGPKRNQEMVDRADYAVAFWNRISPGTKSLIELAERKEIPIFICDISK